MKNPKKIILFIIGKCNLKCSYCFQSKDFKQSKKIINYQDFEKYIIPCIKKFGIKTIQITGGEPFLNKAFLLDFFLNLKNLKKELGLKQIIITTNLTIYDERIFDLINKNIDLIKLVISIDGNKKSHNINRGLFDITYKNLKKLIDNNFFEKQDDLVLKQKVNLEKVSNNLSFEIKSKKIIKKLSNYQINFVINPYNLKFLIDSIDFLKALNIKIKFMIAAEYKLEEYLKNDFENMLKKMIKNHKYKKYFIKIFLSNFYKLTNACREDFLSSIIVNTDLKVVPCSLWTSILIKNYDFDNINILHIKKYTKTARLKILNQIFKSKHFLDATKKNLSICHLVNINTINGLKLILYKKIKNNDGK